MVRHAKALLLVAVLVAIGCAARPKIITYIPVLFLDPREARAIGKMECDVFGQPVIYVHPAISKERRAWVIVHERLHVQQATEYGGCEPFQQRMIQDSLFRLEQEASAYCGVLGAQQITGTPPDPSYPDIVGILREKYYSAYDSSAVAKALLPCVSG